MRLPNPKYCTEVSLTRDNVWSISSLLVSVLTVDECSGEFRAHEQVERFESPLVSFIENTTLNFAQIQWLPGSQKYRLYCI
jgi:hypothetical protein